jgi:hypothetical protein
MAAEAHHLIAGIVGEGRILSVKVAAALALPGKVGPTAESHDPPAGSAFKAGSREPTGVTNGATPAMSIHAAAVTPPPPLPWSSSSLGTGARGYGLASPGASACSGRTV